MVNGIPGLFAELSAAAWHGSLMELALCEGLDRRWGPKRYTVGVNASDLVDMLIDTSTKARVSSPPLPEAKRFLDILLNLARTPAMFLFIFDGKERHRRGSNPNRATRQDTVTMIVEEFIVAFGFIYRKATGESAESELARLNSCAFVDSVLSLTGDALLFGAPTVLQWVGEVDGSLIVNRYRLCDLNNHECVALSRSGLILVALLTGGTYSQGIPGLGIKTAIALARYGLGQHLVDIANLSLSTTDIPRRLREWKVNLCTVLVDDPVGRMRLGARSCSRVCQQITQLPLSFFDLDLIRIYLHPTTQPLMIRPISGSFLIPLPPSLDRILDLCDAHLCWRNYETLEQGFLSLLWPVLYMREAYRKCDPNVSDPPEDDLDFVVRGDPLLRWLSVPAIETSADPARYLDVLKDHMIGNINVSVRKTPSIFIPTTIVNRLRSDR